MNETLQKIKDNFGDTITVWDESHAGKVYIDLNDTKIRTVASHMHNAAHARFISITASDVPSGIELLYHFSLDSAGLVVSFRVLLADKQDPSIETIAPLFRGAHWIEREVHELMGVNFAGNSEQNNHLLLPEDWPGGVYPLRKTFVSEKARS